MRKLFIFTCLCLVVALGSCVKDRSLVPYDQYELADYNGYVVTGKFESSKEGMFNITLHSDSIGYTNVLVSEKTFSQHNLGDTINVVRPVEETQVDTTEKVQSAPFEVKLMNVEWAGHIYIVTSVGGIEHDWGNCPCMNQ
jgi:hypothetical protein